MTAKYDAEDYVTLINRRKGRYSNTVGYCRNLTHRGFVSKAQLKEHDCIEKRCPYFTRHNESYWANIENKRLMTQKRREDARQTRLMKEERERFIRGVFEPYIHVRLTSITEMKTADLRPGLMITYIYDGFVDLSEAVRVLRRAYNCPIYLKAVRSSEEIRKQLIRNQTGGV